MRLSLEIWVKPVSVSRVYLFKDTRDDGHPQSDSLKYHAKEVKQEAESTREDRMGDGRRLASITSATGPPVSVPGGPNQP